MKTYMRLFLVLVLFTTPTTGYSFEANMNADSQFKVLKGISREILNNRTDEEERNVLVGQMNSMIANLSGQERLGIINKILEELPVVEKKLASARKNLRTGINVGIAPVAAIVGYVLFLGMVFGASGSFGPGMGITRGRLISPAGQGAIAAGIVAAGAVYVMVKNIEKGQMAADEIHQNLTKLTQSLIEQKTALENELLMQSLN